MPLRVTKRERHDLLRGVWLFSACTTRELGFIESITTLVLADAGKVLARQGETGGEFFVIAGGTATASIDGRALGTLGPGSFFGEMALLDGGPRVATVTAATPMALLVLARREFDSLIEASMPTVARKMLTALGGRLRQADRALVDGAATPDLHPISVTR